ncbi:3-dehydroquinate synthase [Emticicia oligotrophica DSM 17448]|uniref:3-dehydroquinate synthase n=1 Tax=Emticicia oligotrophica (strain DSM 17448 / CIP 109782 / MTCC 6937 / GPTSA100-15) TaxID=929562 RepID=A0ABN4AN00_EMTOG|nr:3-dehydroquinate synthase [Emticicia oligotrophica]AFK03703.1 3-dehydroquinate synthase [Emticicia oligotrophica DSM 17448]
MSVIISPISESLKTFLETKSYSKIIVLTDTNTKRFCYPVIKDSLPKHTVITVKNGEEHKNLQTCEVIWSAMTEAQLDRHALMINLGGGVIGDMGGFCAATYKRGIDFIQIPTTLLSQVDASVGGKLGIDFQGFKNHLGVFTLPNAVLIDPVFLETLSEREKRSGFAEILKHCLIQDGDKWQVIRKRDLADQDLPDLIAHSVEIKKKVVEQDPTEKGLRKILNFGHTLGHAVETFFLPKGKKKLLHGEAIATGMVCESYIAYERGLIDEKTLEQIEEFIFSIYGKVEMDAADFDTIIALTQQDKKNKGKEVRFSLINAAGSCLYDIVVTKNEMKKALEYYKG